MKAYEKWRKRGENMDLRIFFQRRIASLTHRIIMELIVYKRNLNNPRRLKSKFDGATGTPPAAPRPLQRAAALQWIGVSWLRTAPSLCGVCNHDYPQVGRVVRSKYYCHTARTHNSETVSLLITVVLRQYNGPFFTHFIACFDADSRYFIIAANLRAIKWRIGVLSWKMSTVNETR